MKSIVSENKNKVIRITRNSTCLDMFDPSEDEYSCDKCKNILDTLLLTRKRKGRSKCDQTWRSNIGLYREGRIALRHKEVYEFLKTPKSIKFKHKHAHVTKNSNKEGNELGVNVDIIKDIEEINIESPASCVSSLTNSSADAFDSSRKQKRRTSLK